MTRGTPQEAQLNALLPGRVRTDEDTRRAWGTDWTRIREPAPSAVVFPQSVDEVVALVQWANQEQTALVPSGGRTGLSGGAVAADGEVVVSFDRMNRILDFNPRDRLVTLQAGVVTAALQAFAQENGLYYPVDFASAGSSQIGGNIATNAGGIKVIRYGLTRDWVAGVKVVTGDGRVIDANRGLIKNATGYDLRHLVVGSEGTLGLIVEAQMRLAPAPGPQTVMVAGVGSLADVLELLEALQTQVSLAAFEFFSEHALTKVLAHRELRRPLADAFPFYALVEFDSADLETVARVYDSLADAGLIRDAVLSQSDAQAAELWQLREGISEAIAPFTPYKNDIAVRVSQMPDVLAAIDRLVTGNYPDFEVCWYGHIGDGNLHLNILKPDGMDIGRFYERCHRISPKLFEVVAEHGGSISAEHGVGLLKRDFLGFSRSEDELALMRALKRTFDPRGILNPGKLFAPAS